MHPIALFSPRAARLAGALAAGLIAACAGPGPDPVQITRGTVIHDVTVVDTRNGAVRPHLSVVIEADKITRMLPASQVRAVGDAKVIAATGRYVVPGYLDMHTHVLPMIDAQPHLWSVLLAHGITGVRQMAGSAELIRRARELNQRSATGLLEAPTILAVPGEPVLGVRTAEQARGLVRAQVNGGADFVKLLAGTREGVLTVLDEARQARLPVAGHLPLSISASDAAQAGMAALEHLGATPGVLLDCAADEPAIRRAIAQIAPPPFTPLFVLNPIAFRPGDVPLFQRIVETYDDARCRQVVKTAVQAGVWQAPTLIRLRTMQLSNDPAYATDPNLAYVDKTTQAAWRQANDRFVSAIPPQGLRTLAAMYTLQQRLVKLLHEAGSPLMAGSDLGGGWVIPGWSLHQEFRELATAGLSPLAVLQSATIHGARFLQREATMGSVDEGKLADLVLLSANPLDDVANLGRIEGLVLKGRYLPRQQLDQMKEAAARAYAAQPVGNVASVLDPNHRH